MERRTPYQGNKRCFGAFECEPCDRSWLSGSSWANMGQKCNTCQENVYPHKQWPLKRNKKSKDNKKPHPQELCEMCIELGRFCRDRFKAIGNDDTKQILNRARAQVANLED